MVPTAPNEAPGFPRIPIRDARSAEWVLTNPLSLTPNVRGHRFQMHHYRHCAGDPLMSWRCEPLSFAYLYIPFRGADPISCRHTDSQLVCLQCLEPAEKPERLSFSSS
jgi:hypothetical protein